MNKEHQNNCLFSTLSKGHKDENETAVHKFEAQHLHHHRTQQKSSTSTLKAVKRSRHNRR